MASTPHDRRITLTREHVLTVALALLDEVGLEGLTMRRLATALDVRHGALYWHFADKRALLDALAERILDGVADVDATGDPFDRLSEIARRLRRALLARRDGARVVAGTYVIAPNTLATAEANVTAALAAGAGDEEAVLFGFAMQEYVLGHTIEEQSRLQLQADGETVVPADPIDAERHPTLHRVLSPPPRGARGEGGFDYGLALMIAGARARWARD